MDCECRRWVFKLTLAAEKLWAETGDPLLGLASIRPTTLLCTPATTGTRADPAQLRFPCFYLGMIVSSPYDIAQGRIRESAAD
jgi:hypothetical protein